MDKPVDIELLRTLSPLDALKTENLTALVRKVKVDEQPGGRFLFRAGDEEKRTVYLLSGEVELRKGDKVTEIIEGGSTKARHPLAPGLPRPLTCRARSRIKYLSIDTDLIDVMLTWDQTGSYEVNELRGSKTVNNDDWMTTLLRTKAFHKIPPANIQAIFMRMQQMNYKAGDVVIKQGAEGDYFYVITAGKVQVTRETPLNREGIKLAELSVGESFGEEALISEAKRNATVVMLTDGSVMRLAKSDFNKLMHEPMLQWISFPEAEKIVEDGGQWLDVRLPSEFQNFHRDGAVNIPLYFLRLKLNVLDRDTRYIVCCDTGRRSSAAAFILGERGFNVYVLQGGLTMGEAVA